MMPMAIQPTEGLWTSQAMAAVLHIIDRVAPTQLSVLITGESGTGKEVVARALHARSAVADKPLVIVDCAAIPPSLLESELFGHSRGAFTGAVRDRSGLVEAADGGTFFLDEIGELPPSVQVKLLRLLEDGSYRPIGQTEPRSAQIRVIAATNQEIDEAVDGGLFRADLYHRLNGCRIHLPPLRERRADIVPLFEHYLLRFADESGRDPLLLGAAASALLEAASWPGNVRELVNCAQYIASLAQGPEVVPTDLPTISSKPLPEAPRPLGDRIDLDLPYKAAKRQVLDLFEADYVGALLERHGGNISAAARAAGIDRRSIQRILKRMNES
jgi:DNA-binding NtrC family response regulator